MVLVGGNNPGRSTALARAAAPIAGHASRSTRSAVVSYPAGPAVPHWTPSILANREHVRCPGFQCRLALGGVALRPWRARAAEESVAGARPDGAAFRRAAELALADAKPSGDNAFKIELARREQSGVGLALQYHVRLSSKIPVIAQTRAHTLSHEGRHEMGGVPDK